MHRTLARSATAAAATATNSVNMLILSESQVRQCLDGPSCLAAARRALIAVADGTAQVPSRLGLPYHSGQPQPDEEAAAAAADYSLFKPAALQSSAASSSSSSSSTTTSTTTDQMGVKVVSIRRGNGRRGLPLVPATVLHMDPATGAVDAVVAGTHLTAARTAAGPALAVQAAGRTANGVVVFGAGQQAEEHVRAISVALQTRPLPRVTLVNRSAPRAEQLAARLRQEGWVSECPVLLLRDRRGQRDAFRTADVICATTNAAEPLWDESLSRCLPRDCVLTGIGSYTPAMHEVPAHAVDRCQRVWIDTPEALAVGDLKHLQQPNSNGGDSDSDNNSTARNTQPPIALLGDVLLQQQQQQSDTDVDGSEYKTGRIFFKGVGTAIMDVLAADVVVQRARALQIGTVVDMS